MSAVPSPAAAPLLALDHVGKDYAKVDTRGGQLRLVFDLLRGAGAAHVFRALDDVSFSLQPGESLGVIGENGAGKSTLLKIVAGVVPPTRGKVQVNEVFWYGCGHCYALDPALENWKTSKPDYIEFVRTPVMWGPVHRQHAKIFYTLQALNRADLHAVVFDAIVSSRSRCMEVRAVCVSDPPAS